MRGAGDVKTKLYILLNQQFMVKVNFNYDSDEYSEGTTVKFAAGVVESWCVY